MRAKTAHSAADSNRALVTQELNVRLASYFDIPLGETTRYRHDLEHSLQVLTLTLERLSATPDHPDFRFALDSIRLVVQRLHATQLEHCLEGLNNLDELSPTLRTQNIRALLAFLKALN